MKFIDTHTHLFLKEFDTDRKEVIQAAMTAGVGKLILPNVDSSTLPALFSLEAAYPGVCIAACGLHPGSVKKNYQEELTLIKNALSHNGVAAIGEIGIDLYWDKTYRKEQEDVFKTQIAWALEAELPVIVHNREAFDEILGCLNEFKKDEWKGIFHCFTGDAKQADRVIGMGFKLGIGGVVTYKNGGIDKLLHYVGLKHIVLETDAPYLAPVPKRGKRNESAYIIYIAGKIAEILNRNVNYVAEMTTKNAKDVFSLK